jgi:hypothetical protein
MLKKLIVPALAAITFLSACDKKNSELVEPLTSEEFPQVIRFDDAAGGELEDNDNFSFTLTLNERVDPGGNELSGTVVPLSQDVTVSFEVDEASGIDDLAAFVKDVKAFYEIDDCTNSDDAGIDLNLQFDPSTGKGSVRFPKDVQEIEIEFETDEEYLDDDILNDEPRTIAFRLTGVSSADATITYNPSLEFVFEVLDNEGIAGEWELDHEDDESLSNLRSLFGIINEEIGSVAKNDIDKVEFKIEYDEVTLVIELNETESIEECGETEVVNKLIELEAEIDEIDFLNNDGELEFTGEVEQQDGTLKEFTYKGSFQIVDDELLLTLTGEFGDDETDEITLILKR